MWLSLVVIFVVALGARLGFLRLKRPMRTQQFLSNDAREYDSLAVSLLSGRGLSEHGRPTARRLPLYPVFLAVCYRALGRDFYRIRRVQAILGALTCVVAAVMGLAVFGPRAGTAAGLLTAVHYPLVQVSCYAITDTLYILLFAVAVTVTWLSHAGRKRVRCSVACGMIWGLAALCRTVGIGAGAVSLVWLAFASYRAARKAERGRNLDLSARLIPARWWVPPLVSAALFALTLSPWVVRNALLFHAFVPGELALGEILYMGYGPGATGGTDGTYWWSDVQRPSGPLPEQPKARDAHLLRLALSEVRFDPGRALRLAGRKFVNLWRPYYGRANRLSKVLYLLCDYVVLLPLALVGAVMAWRRGDAAFPLLAGLLFVYTVLLACATIAEIRYRYPLTPLAAVMGGFALAEASVAKARLRGSLAPDEA